MSTDSQCSNLAKMHDIVQDQIKNLKEYTDMIKKNRPVVCMLIK
jgi:hypothetical protein